MGRKTLVSCFRSNIESKLTKEFKEDDELPCFELTCPDLDLEGEPSATAALLGLEGAFIIFDLTKSETLKGISSLVRRVRNSNPKAALILLGNKMDLCYSTEDNGGSEVCSELELNDTYPDDISRNTFHSLLPVGEGD